MPLPLWAVALALIVAAGYAVPYLLLQDVERWTGAFGFWVVFGLAVWGLLVGVVARWRPGAPPPRQAGGAPPPRQAGPQPPRDRVAAGHGARPGAHP